MLHCGDFKHGFAFYGCKHYGKLKYDPFRCKSRFCMTFENLYLYSSIACLYLVGILDKNFSDMTCLVAEICFWRYTSICLKTLQKMRKSIKTAR